MPKIRCQRIVRRLGREALCCGLALAVVLVANSALACPTCKEGIAENDPDAQRLAAGFYYSILFMLSMPFVVLGTFGSVCYRAVRKARAAQAQS